MVDNRLRNQVDISKRYGKYPKGCVLDQRVQET